MSSLANAMSRNSASPRDVPVWTSTSAPPTASSTASLAVSTLCPSAGNTPRASTRPPASRRASAGARNSADCRSISAPPWAVATPTTSTVRGARSVDDRVTWSPGCRPPRAASPASTTTSSGASGARPAVRANGVSTALSQPCAHSSSTTGTGSPSRAMRAGTDTSAMTRRTTRPPGRASPSPRSARTSPRSPGAAPGSRGWSGCPAHRSARRRTPPQVGSPARGRWLLAAAAHLTARPGGAGPGPTTRFARSPRAPIAGSGGHRTGGTAE